MPQKKLDRNRPPMTVTHFTLFGQIVCAYALAETLLKQALAVALETDPRVVFALTDRVASISLINKAKALCAHILEEKERDSLIELAARLEAAGLLRNHIAHSQWAAGTREGSIRPSGIQVRSRGLDAKGFDDKEPDYTLSELNDAANEIYQLGSDIIAYLQARGFKPST